MRTNALCWNPREPFIFATANEDHNCYTFDMRKIDQAVLIHKDHVQAVYVPFVVVFNNDNNSFI